MRISTSNNSPTIGDLMSHLRNKFSDSYSFHLSGIGKEKTIIARKSTLVGAQISTGENEIRIDTIFPSMPFRIIRNLLFYGCGDVGMIMYVFPSRWIKVQNELGSFIKGSVVR